jgi:hypothetical protein
MGSTCSKGCMVSTTLYGIYNSTNIPIAIYSRILGFILNAGMNQS